MRQSELLTGDEREVLTLLGKVAGKFNAIIASGPTRQADMQEAFAAIHRLQRMVAAQAAARVFPAEFRLLGGVIDGEASDANKD